MKITRGAFVYIEGKGDTFAQCSTCTKWEPRGKICVDPLDMMVLGSWSCCLYSPGSFANGERRKTMTPEEAGLYKGAVRCENCKYAYKGVVGTYCGLYGMLNDQLGDDFELDERIDPYGCCNAFTPKE